MTQPGENTPQSTELPTIHRTPVTAPVPPEIPTSPAIPTTPHVKPAELAEAVRQVEREKSRRKIARRALIGAAGVGLCVGAVELGPTLVKDAGLYTEQQLQDALQAGVQQGRQAVLAELKQLEGVSLDVAIGITEVAGLAIKFIVKPILDLSNTIAGDILGALAGAASGAQSLLAHFGQHVSYLDAVVTLLTSWQQNVSQEQLASYAQTDVAATEAYLRALKAKIDATPPPT